MLGHSVAWLLKGQLLMVTAVVTSHPVDCRSVLSSGMTPGCDVVFALFCIQHATTVYSSITSSNIYSHR